MLTNNLGSCGFGDLESLGGATGSCHPVTFMWGHLGIGWGGIGETLGSYMSPAPEQQ